MKPIEDRIDEYMPRVVGGPTCALLREALRGALDTPEPPCQPDCEKCRATAEDPEPDDDPNAWRPRKFA